MPYLVRTETFEGPFDLLLHLIARQKVDIWQVSLARITEDYLAEIRRMRELNLEVATEFLVVAATLLELKAARLLPRPEEGPDEVEALLEERDLLFARLLQYRAYKQAAELIAARLEEQAAYVPCRSGPLEAFNRAVPDLLAGVTPEQLAQLAARALAPAPPPRVSLEHLAAPPKLTVHEAVGELAARLRGRGPVAFTDLLGPGAPLVEVVVYFLAALELYKRGEVDLDQAQAFGSIVMRWTGGDEAAAREDLTEEPA